MPPIYTRTHTPFPYTTLFRAHRQPEIVEGADDRDDDRDHAREDRAADKEMTETHVESPRPTGAGKISGSEREEASCRLEPARWRSYPARGACDAARDRLSPTWVGAGGVLARKSVGAGQRGSVRVGLGG